MKDALKAANNIRKGTKTDKVTGQKVKVDKKAEMKKIQDGFKAAKDAAKGKDSKTAVQSGVSSNSNSIPAAGTGLSSGSSGSSSSTFKKVATGTALGAGAGAASATTVKKQSTLSKMKDKVFGVKKPGYKKSSNFDKFSGKSKSSDKTLPTFDKNLNKKSYLDKLKKSNLVKGAVVIGTAYLGYKAAKKAKKKLSKSYMMGMKRPKISKSRDFYRSSSKFFYRGQLNDYCDIWFSSEFQEEIMRCDEGYYYNYDKEFIDSPNYDQNYKNFNVRNSDWDKQSDYRKIDDDFDRDYQAVYWDKSTTDSVIEGGKKAFKMALWLIIVIVLGSCLCCVCLCVGVGYMVKKAKGGSGDDDDKEAGDAQEEEPMN